MSTDHIDDIFKSIMINFKKLFGYGFINTFNDRLDDFVPVNISKEVVDEHGSSKDVKSSFFGYEVVSGSDLKEPVIRIYGNPDDFTALKGSLERMLGGVGHLGAVNGEESVVSLTGSPSNESEVIEPFTETYSRGDSFVATLDLPGINAGGVVVAVEGNRVLIDATSETKHYRKEITLDFIPEEADVHHAINNSLLEVMIKKPTE
nr:Hsp20/alpha crystallin family protein [Candidatus Sigynarchaeota archaeon]